MKKQKTLPSPHKHQKSARKQQKERKRGNANPIKPKSLSKASPSPINEHSPVNNTNMRWGHKELANLHLAIALAINPKSESDWNKIAEAVSKGLSKKKSGEECKARAKKDGLLSEDLEPTHNQKKHLAIKSSKSLLKSTSLQHFDEIHIQYYDEFFSQKESPLNATLDLDDSLISQCFKPSTTYYRIKRTRNQPFIMPLAYDSPAENFEDNS